jgi:ATP-dependent DNA helicase RecG
MNQKDLYAALNASTEEDILRHFPVRYESLKPTLFNPVPADSERTVVKGTVSGLKSLQIRGTSLIRFHIQAFGNHDIPAILYNQPFYLTKLSQGAELLFVLYYSDARKAYIVSSIHDLDSYYVMTGIRPMYALPKAVSASYFVSTVKKLLSYPKPAAYTVSPLPQRLIDKYRLENEFDAFRSVHLPKDDDDKHNGLRVFKYEEALSYAVQALTLKNKANARKKQETLSIDKEQVNAFVKSLAVTLTKDQLTAIREIILDMDKETVMYRLLQGDVGTGKTLVSFVALFANALRKKQGVMMAPTFELASQHYRNALKIFNNTGIKIGFLAGNSLPAKEKASLLKGLESGEVNILFSTTSALSESIHYQDLGLIVVDEQQLFGVEQREALLLRGKAVDLLMMSATPIPRTLSQIINADVEVSTLEQFPQGVRNVKTAVVRSSDPLITKAINKALVSHRQVFIIVPKIDEGNGGSSAETVYKDITERFVAENCQLLHGRIKKEDQDRIYQAFLSNEKPILVSTTVVEVGIDVSSACLLIVYDANCFGLSALHQLRGRIGRSGDFALALLVYDGKDPEAQEKLQFLSDNTDGLRISEFDLRKRGSGSYSGERQSGRSELQVCNFVEDQKVFLAAKEDAKEILAEPQETENANYLHALGFDKAAHLA